jgi:hypothetical protein
MNIVSVQATYADSAHEFLTMVITFTENQGQGQGSQQNMTVSVPVSTTVEPWAAIVADVLSGTYGPIAEVPGIGVPKNVSLRQFRLALYMNDKLVAFATAVNNLPQPQRDMLTIDWEYANYIDRNSSLVTTVGAAIGMSSVALDSLFKQAITL